MATAETQRKEEDRSQDASPGGNRSSRSSRRSTRQLDFFQAMSDFKAMFPTLDDEVIEAVLRANDGAVDATIDQLLTMTIDEGLGDGNLPMGGEEFGLAGVKYPDHTDTALLASGVSQSVDSPPSYSEAMKNPGSHDRPSSIWTTPIRPMSTPQIDNEREIIVEPLGALGGLARLSPGALPKQASTGSVRFSPSHERSSSFGANSRSSFSDLNNANTARKREFRNWNPPMLGNLPDDFLRIMSPDKPTPSCANDSDFERLSNLTTTPVNVMSLTDARPKIHKSRAKSEKSPRAFSLSSKDGEKDVKSKSSDKRSRSGDKVVRSFSVVEDTSRSKGARHKDKHIGLPQTHGSVIIETHDFSKDMLEERMKENERRRKRTSAEFDPELAQYLEDEQLALALQNSEFLRDLRGNDEFMKTLQRESSSEGNLSSHTSTTSNITPVRPPDSVHEGYGDDSDKTLDAFPFTTGKEKDEDAQLRQQLRGMGKASRKQFASLAKKFFKRKKKNSKQILDKKLAPSTLNLLEDEDEEEEDLHVDPRYNSSPPEIEPLPSTLIGVPSHRTVQRPAYKPDGVTTHFNRDNVDMV